MSILDAIEELRRIADVVGGYQPIKLSSGEIAGIRMGPNCALIEVSGALSEGDVASLENKLDEVYKETDELSKAIRLIIDNLPSSIKDEFEEEIETIMSIIG